MSFKEQIDLERLPVHVAVIMDGNGRWAKERGEDRIYGHQHGVDSVRECTEAAAEIGVKHLTMYAFSTENWNRPKEEVELLMELLIETIEKETPTLNKNNIRLMAIGDLERLPADARAKLHRCILDTSKNTRMNLVLALSYSSRWEITHATKQIADKVKNGELDVNEITDDVVSNHLTTKDIPDPDLMIRTSGEIRISNFLLWQSAYTEFYFTETHWPDFRKENFYQALVDYQKRERRFGK
ncbi:MAG: isoprenyl transferase [Bacteroidales bacterium]|nr:isoprenyl transferase [Bacteroidales bacterium]